jgi:hypothetical protein
VRPVAANAVFAILAPHVRDRLQAAQAGDITNSPVAAARLMTSW